MRQLTLVLLFVIGAGLSLTAYSNTDRHIEYPTYSAHVNNISIAYQDFGEPTKGTILLVMGLGAQMIVWDDQIVNGFVDAGYRVIRFDNRDVGWSQKFDESSTPGLMTGVRFKLGMSLGAPYKLDDMAKDAHELLNHLNVKRAHVVGVSMGGMIAQIMAAKYPEQVASLTSIMSTSGAEHLPTTELDIDFSARGETRDEIITATAELVQQFGGSAATEDKDELYKRIARTFDRSYYPDGTARQFWAILDSGDRVELLKTIKQPSLVMHGTEDTLVMIEGGRHTAELIKGSKFVALEGMGHNIDQLNLPIIVNEVLKLAATVN